MSSFTPKLSVVDRLQMKTRLSNLTTTHSSFLIHAVVVNVDELLRISARLVRMGPEILRESKTVYRQIGIAVSTHVQVKNKEQEANYIVLSVD